MPLLLTFLFLLLPIVVEGAVPPTSAEQAYQPTKNLLQNPGFEEGVQRGWVKTGGNYVQGVDNGNRTGGWNPLASSLTYGQTVSTGRLAGQPCMAQINYKGGDSGYTFELVDGSNNVLRSQVLTARTAFGNPVAALFTCPTGNVTMRLRSTTATPATITLDDAYLGVGPVTNIPAQINLGQEWVGSVKIYGCSDNWRQSNTGAFANYAATPTGCQYYIAPGSTGLSAPDTNIPGVKLSGKAGVYRFETGAMIGNDNTTGSSQFRFSDGTIASLEDNTIYGPSGAYSPVVIGLLNYTSSAPTSKTVQIQARTQGANTARVYATTPTLTPVSGDGWSLTINVYRMASASSQAAAFITKEPKVSLASLATTLVTTTPKAIGEYRALIQQAGGGYVDTVPSAAYAPSVANGFRIQANAFNQNGTSGQPNRIIMFVGKQSPAFKTKFFSGANKVGTIDTKMWSVSTVMLGIYGGQDGYNEQDGTITIDAGTADSTFTTRFLGRTVTGSNAQGQSSVTDGYFDIEFYDNPLAAGLSESSTYKMFYDDNGLGSGGFVRRYSVVGIDKGSEATCVDSAVGLECTIKTAGRWCAGMTEISSVQRYFTASIDYAATSSVTLANPIFAPGITRQVGAGDFNSTSWCRDLNIGQVVRPHTSGNGADVNDAKASFWLAKSPTPFEVAGAGGGAQEYSAQVTSASNISVTAGAPIILPTINWDIGGLYNPANGRFTAAVPGRYELECTGMYHTNGGSYLFGYKNGALGGFMIQHVGTSQVYFGKYTAQLNQGDYLTAVSNGTGAYNAAAGFYQPTCTFKKIN